MRVDQTEMKDPAAVALGRKGGKVSTGGYSTSEAKRAANHRQQQVLNQELLGEAAPRRTDRGADCELVSPRRRSHQQQIGDIRARDQQDEADGADKHQQRCFHVAHNALLQRLHAEGLLRTAESWEPTTKLIRR